LAFEYDWSRHCTHFIDDRDAQYKQHIFPLAIIGKGGFSLANWVQGYEQYWRTAAATAKETGNELEAEQATLNADNANDFGEYLRSLTEEYQIAYIEHDQQLPIDKVCDIFTQINSCPYRKPKMLTRTRESVDSSLDERSFQTDLVWLDRIVPVAGCARSRNPSAPASAQHPAARNAEAGRPWQH
jgi:hypothetical protein